MLEKKTVLITGATGGIGEATTRHLVEEGFHVIMVGRNQSKLNALADELGTDVSFFTYDLRDLYNIESIFLYASSKDIKLDGFVHCAGINNDTAIRANDVDSMVEVTTVNYMSFVELMKFFSKKKYSNNGASVVAVSSRATKYPAKAMCTYAASKAALEVAVTVSAMEMAHRGIRVNAVLPGGTDTDMLKKAGITAEQVEALQPLGLIPPESVAEVIGFLLGNKARYITGAKLTVDGGQIV